LTTFHLERIKKKYSLYPHTVGLFLIDPLQRDLYCFEKKTTGYLYVLGYPAPRDRQIQ